LREAVDEYATRAREILERERAAGRPFEDAWSEVEGAIRPLDAKGWGTLEGRDWDGVETPLAFLYRHFRAAYVGRSAARYCADDCPAWAEPDSDFCEVHDQLTDAGRARLRACGLLDAPDHLIGEILHG
jgi:hypothetical protein